MAPACGNVSELLKKGYTYKSTLIDPRYRNPRYSNVNVWLPPLPGIRIGWLNTHAVLTLYTWWQVDNTNWLEFTARPHPAPAPTRSPHPVYLSPPRRRTSDTVISEYCCHNTSTPCVCRVVRRADRCARVVDMSEHCTSSTDARRRALCRRTLCHCHTMITHYSSVFRWAAYRA